MEQDDKHLNNKGIENNQEYLTLKHQHDLLQKNNDALKSDLDSTKRILDTRDESIGKYVKTIDEWKNKYMKLQEENNNFKAIIAQLSEKHTEISQTNNDIINDIPYSASHEVAISTKTIQNLTLQIDKLTIERDKYKQLYQNVIAKCVSSDTILSVHSILSEDEDEPEIDDSLLHFSWEIDKNLLDNFKNMKYFLCKSNEIQVMGYEKYKWIFTLESSNNKVALTVSLTQLPNVVGAIKLNFKITCDELLYVKQYDGVVLTIKGDDFFDDFFKDLQKKFQTGIVDKFDLNQFNTNQINSLKFKCSAEILVSYDLFGGVFLKQEKPIMVLQNDLNHKLVFGYLNEMHDFDVDEIESSPMSIYQLIYKYYLMMIVTAENKGEFIWKFNDPTEIKLFMSCNKDDVITSRKFELFGSVFYFELTPNGWGENPKGETLVWLAVESFSKNAVDVEVLYRLTCDEVGYKQQKIEKLTDPRHGAYSTGPSREYNMKIEKFKDLKEWEFKMYLEVRRMWDDRGTIIFQSDSLVEFEDKPMETPIMIAPSDLNHKLVFGYIDEIQSFNANAIEFTSLIYDLIYKYYLMMIVVEEPQDEFVWKFNNKCDIKLFMSCNKDDVIKSRKFELFGNLFYFELTPNGWGSIPEGECVIWLAVESFAKNAVVIEVLYRLTCEKVGYMQQKTEKLIHAIDGTYSISAAVGDKWMKMDKFIQLEEWEFKMFVEVRTMWDKRGTVIYKCDKSVETCKSLIICLETPLVTCLMVAPSEWNEMTVLGYIHDLNLDKTRSCLSCVYDLICKYYLSTIIINGNKGEFMWKFDKKSDMELFMNCAKNDVITSSKFELFDCVFYLELTPNGWGGIPKGECLVWLAVESFAQKAVAAEVLYRLSCDEVGYMQQKIERLSDRRHALSGNYSIGPSLTDTWMKTDQFKDLIQWEFKMYIEVRKMWDEKGNIVYQSENS